jgi:hypothetical protein
MKIVVAISGFKGSSDALAAIREAGRKMLAKAVDLVPGMFISLLVEQGCAFEGVQLWAEGCGIVSGVSRPRGVAFELAAIMTPGGQDA